MLIWPLGLFVFLAESNATNLTDGLDGLAAGCGSVVFTGLGLQLMLRGNQGDPALAAFCLAMAGCWLGFLAHNRHPAKLFMGDTGSLAMGAALSAVALLSNSLWPLLVMGGVFLAESISVIVQVWVFKATKGPDGVGKRVFRMAPLHHHFELGGMDEQQVVISFWTTSLLLVGVGLLLLP
jgi:phospho-N-acetylmuramoyl-pentapeptide-transferase